MDSGGQGFNRIYRSTGNSIEVHFVALDNLFFNLKDTSKNVIPAKAGIHKLMTLLDSRLRGSDKFGIIRGSLNS
jgi:hypothetical protein